MTPDHIMALLAMAHVAAVMSPGANTALVIQAAAQNRRLGLLTAAGFWPAAAVWSAAGLAGVGGLLIAAPWIGTTLRVCCGLYLLLLGTQALRRSFRRSVGHTGSAHLVPWHHALSQGFWTNVTNPKSIAYYMSVFAATGAFDLPPLYRLVAVLLLPSIGLLWYGMLVIIVSSGPMRRSLDAAKHWLDRIAGAAMIFFGFKLLSAR